MNSFFVDDSSPVIVFLVCLVCLLCFGVLWAAEDAKRSANSGRRSRLEYLEARLPLDTQIGTVTMPYDGYLSAAIYDSNGQIIRTLLAQVPEQAGSIPLMWDGKDQLGRTVVQNGTYTWKALTSQVNPLDQGGVGDSEAVPDKISPNQGYNVQSLATSTISGTAGDVGGTFARNDNESYFGDTTLSQSYTLETPISASGTFFFSDVMSMKGKFFIGHFSSAANGVNDREFIGVEFQEGNFDEAINARARINRFNGGALDDAKSNDIGLGAGTGYYNWSYSYDPTGENDIGHTGPEGKLTVRIWNNGGFDVTLETFNDGSHRDAGSTFDSFGMGIGTQESLTGDDPTATAKLFMDDVTYSGNTGLVNFSSNPGWVGVGNTSDGNNYVWNSSSNADGSLIMASHTEEATEINKIAADGTWQWINAAHQNFGVAVDETYVYTTRNISDQDRLHRFFARDGASAPFAPGVDYIVINSSAPDTLPAGRINFHYTQEEWRTLGAWGIAADGYRVWVSNYRNNSLMVYDRSTGALLGQTTMTKPLGIAVDTASSGSGTVWVANNGDRLTKITFNGSFSSSTTITGLTDPTGVAIGGPSHRLFVAESGHGHIHEYDISGTPVLAGMQTFGSKHLGGALTDSQFYWNTLGNTASLAIDPTGILSVTDDHRVQQFYTVTGGGHTAGELKNSLFGEFAPTPVQTYNYTAGGKHYLVSNRYVYEVDPNYTGGPRAGWLGDGTWRLVERYYWGTGEDNYGPGVRRTIMDGGTPREMIYQIYGTTVIAYTLEATGQQRQAAIVGGDWRGPDRMNVVPFNPVNGALLGGRYNWTDTDGDGAVDWNGVGSGTDGEVVWNIPFGQFAFLSGVSWVDDAGNIWINESSNLVKIPLESWVTTANGKRNPVYNWANRVTVVPFQNDQTGSFTPFQVRIAGNGDIYAFGGTNHAAGIYGGWNGQSWFARYNSAGVRQFLAPTVDEIYAGFAIDATDSDPDYFVGGGGIYADVYTKDGLLLTRFTNGAGSGPPTGWMDQPFSVGMFTHPLTGQMYVYGEEVYFGKSTRWRIDNLNTVQRQENTFSYTASTATGGRWEFENNLNDAAGSNTGTFSGGSPAYAAGQIGNAINLDGTDDGVQVPYAGDFNGYTISAWVKADTVSGARNIVSRSASDPNAYSHQLFINSSGKFAHYTLDNLAARFVTSTTTVSAGTWYHVAITASNGGMARLYVNGVEEGTAASLGSMADGGDRFNIGRGNGQAGFFDGLIDDVRIYDVPLGQTDIQTIYNKTDKPTVSVVTTDTTAAEETADKGTFLIRRDNTAGNLTVNYTLTGTATNSTDYTSIAGSVTIPSGSTSVVVTVTPSSDAAVEGNETVILTISSSANYTIGSGLSGSATVNIVDNDSTTVPPNGRWAFEDTVPGNGWGREFGFSDYAGSNNGINHGTTYFDYSPATFWDGPAIYATGLIGRAFSLDGINDSATIPYSNDSAAYTIALRVKPTGTFPANIIARTDATLPNPSGVGTVSEQIRINSSGKFEHFLNDGSGKTVTGTTTVTPGTWYHVAIVASNSGMMRLYVNGTEEGTAQSLGTLWTGGDRFNVGNIVAGMGYFKGLVDDLQIYDAPLTAAQIQAINNQTSTVTVSASDPNAAEPSDTGTFTITRTTTSGSVVVNYTISGSATSGTDFSALAGSVTIANGSSTATVTVTPIDDSTAESNETVVLTVASGTGYSVGTPNNATVTIADNEATVTVSSVDSSASEQGPDTGTVTFTRNNTSGNLVINYTKTGTATNVTDYTSIANSVTILSGQTTATVTVTPVDDAVVEGNETVIFTISSSANYTVGTPNNATVTIADNEPTITVTASDPSAAEQGADVGKFTITRVGNTSGNLVVNFTKNGTATNGTDYTSIVNSVTILSGQATATVTVTPSDDSTAEGDETVILTLSTNASYTVGTPNSATVTIADNEATVTVVAADANASEQGPDTGTFIFTRVGNTSGNLVVNFTKNGTATNGTDYTSIVNSVTILSGQSTATVTVTPTDDSTAEVSETVVLTISSSANYFVGSPNNATVNIADNESTVTVIASDANAAEQGADPGVFTFTRTNTSGDLVVNFVKSGTATNSTDYTSIANSVTILSGQTTALVTVTPVDDSAAEGSETVIFTISSSSTYFTGTPSSDTVTIVDNESTVTVSATDAAAAEQGANTGTVTFTRTNTSGNLVVNFAKSGTATNSTDYSSIGGSVTILSGSSTATVTVTPIDDGTAEGNETVIFTISSNSNYFIGTPNSATVTIADNDATVAGQAGGTFARNDNESYFGDTSLSQSYTLNSTITASGTVTVSNADTMHGKFFVGHFSLSTADDRREFMGLELVEGDVDGYVGARARIMRFNGSAVDDAYSGYVNLTSAGGPYTFSYSYDPNYEAGTEDGAGGTHSGPEGRLTLNIAGQTLYAINHGSHRDAGSTFDSFGMGIGTMESMTGDDPTSTAKLFLDDVTFSGNTGTVDFNTDPGWISVGNISDGNSYGWNLVNVNATDASAAEQGADVGKFTISRATSTGNLTVFYTLSGAATSGSDFSALPGSVVIPDGQTSATITVTPIDDLLAESSEAVVLTIATNAAYSIGTPSGATLNIADNESTVTVTATDASAAEPSDTGTFTITRTNTSGNLTINYTINGTATSGTDYSALSGSVIIPNGQASAAVMVTPINDSTTESDETVTLTISSSANHFVGVPSNATVNIADDDGVVAGQAGGTFARNDNESYFGDTTLSQSYTLDSSITAAGTFTFSDADTIQGKFFVGHFSSGTGTNQREFMGAEFVKGDANGWVGVQARIYRFNGSAVDDAYSGYVNLISTNGPYYFDYTYDPNYNADGGSPEGRLALHVYNNAGTINSTIYAINDASHRAAGSTFDSFGMGIATMESMTGDDPTKTAKLFIDDVTFSGNTGMVNFNTNPGWVGVGNTTDGNSYGWVQQNDNVISVSASDANAAEQAADPGTFTISRGVTTGDVTVYYNLSGTATNGTDYSTIAGSVTILNGQTSALVTVTPINDTTAEGNETVILTISTDASYAIGAPGNATVTIADNDGFAQSQIGGTFARNDNESYFGDTTLSQSYTLDSSITANGLFFAQDSETMAGKLFVGHFSSSTATDRREFMGAEFMEGDLDGLIGVRARIMRFNGSAVDDAYSAYINLIAGSGYFHFDYTYDPNYNADGGSPEGRLALRIYNDALTVDSTIYAINDASHRAAGSTFDAFGMGIGTMESMTGDNSASTVKVFVDDVTYSGNTGTVNFNSDPGWVGVGNNSDGNNYGWSHQLAQDGFETATTSGGTGWAAAWTLTGNASITGTGTPKTGSYHLQLTGNNGVASRALNLAGVTTATLSFDWKANSFEAGETAVVEIYNGTSWVTVQTVTDGQDDNAYHHSDIDLSGYALGSGFQVRFRSLMSATDDFFYIDNLQIAL